MREIKIDTTQYHFRSRGMGGRGSVEDLFVRFSYSVLKKPCQYIKPKESIDMRSLNYLIMFPLIFIGNVKGNYFYASSEESKSLKPFTEYRGIPLLGKPFITFPLQKKPLPPASLTLAFVNSLCSEKYH